MLKEGREGERKEEDKADRLLTNSTPLQAKGRGTESAREEEEGQDDDECDEGGLWSSAYR